MSTSFYALLVDNPWGCVYTYSQVNRGNHTKGPDSRIDWICVKEKLYYLLLERLEEFTERLWFCQKYPPG